MISLPIDKYLPDIISLWNSHSKLLINASAGSGKTTRIPWALASRTNKRVVVLEPRKLAARMAARRIADENGLTLGQEIGYAYRDDVQYQDESKVIFFTEGTFLRFFSNDQFLESIDTVIFDEFHERHLETDLCLALVRRKMKDHPGLKFILMSATIDEKMVNDLKAHYIEIDSKLYQVKTHYLPNVPSILNQSIEVKIKNILHTLPSSGDVLVFLPGMRDILKISDHISSKWGDVFILHSEIDKAEQEKVLLPSPRRKIILSTNIAESSVTLPGIKFIIDSGLANVSEYNPWTGIKLLVERPITQASAIQRMYRAGRTQDGECYRLYSEFDYLQRQKFIVPEILTNELNEAYLLSCFYEHQLEWPTPPSEEKWKKARHLCELLGLSHHHQLTVIGEFALKYQLNIRVAKILWMAQNLKSQDKEDLLGYICRFITKEDPKYLRRKLRHFLSSEGQEKMREIAPLILAGMVDQVVKFRPQHHDYIHFSGNTLKMHPSKGHPGEGLYIAVSINHRGLIEELLEIEEEWLIDMEPYPLIETQDIIWTDNRIQSRHKTSLGSINLEEQLHVKSWDQLSAMEKNRFLEKNQQKFQALIEEFKETSFFQRTQFYLRVKNLDLNFKPSFREFMDYSLGIVSMSDDFFKYQVEQELGISIDQEVPETITLHQKKFVIHYQNEASIEGYIQEFYGLSKTPIVLGQALTLILLGPHKRPIQYTKDLAGFWQRTYQEMQKELRRDYPRHHWPENPQSAPPVLLKRQLS